ncbi:MAG: hypothetical protein ACP5T0_04355 [Verrucomicrobiia bacterium]
MEEKTVICPLCGNKGKSVSSMTINSLVKPEKLSLIKSPDGFYFCSTPDCAAAYFNPVSGEVIYTADVKVVIYQKNKDPERPICYCFNHTVKEIIEDFKKHGRSLIMEDMKAKCAAGLARCAETNPQGSCCLGNIQKLIEETFQKTIRMTTKCCCGVTGNNQCCQ